MMTIDLRYTFPLIGFYAPGVMLLFGGWVLGYSLDEMRDAVAAMGAVLGLFGFGVGCIIFTESPPIHITLFRGEGK